MRAREHTQCQLHLPLRVIVWHTSNRIGAAATLGSVETRAVGGFKRKHFTMDITFKDLSLKLRTNGNTVLNRVNGTIHHGRMTAVMGPSGSGKTTFMTTLAGRAHYGRMHGAIYVNGKKDRITNYKNLTGFVPQEV